MSGMGAPTDKPASVLWLDTTGPTPGAVALEADGRLDKQTIMHSLAAAFEFPDYFGWNWDAARDLLMDQLEQQQGPVLWQFSYAADAEINRADLAEWSSLMNAVCEYAESVGVPLRVVVQQRLQPSSLSRDAKLAYVDDTLRFHFRGNFTRTIEEHGFGEEEINGWVSLAWLYQQCREQGLIPQGREDAGFALIEDLHCAASVDIALGLGLDELDLSEIGVGYDEGSESFPGLVDYAFSVLEQHGTALWRLVS